MASIRAFVLGIWLGFWSWISVFSVVKRENASIYILTFYVSFSEVQRICDRLYSRNAGYLIADAWQATWKADADTHHSF